jgi:cyclase
MLRAMMGVQRDRRWQASVTLNGAVPRYDAGLTKLARDTWAWLQPNGAWGEANAGFVAGEGASAVIDTLWDEPQARRFLASLSPHLPDAPIQLVVNTHSDGDHWWGNAVMPPGVEFVTSQPSLDAMREEAAPTQLARLSRVAGLGARLPGPAGDVGSYVHAMLKPFAFANTRTRLPDRAFRGRESLTVGGRRLDLIEVGPAHTVGDLIVSVPDVSVVFAADVLFVRSTPVMWHGPIETWLGALDTLIALEADVYVPGHGPTCGKQGVVGLRDLMTTVADGTRAARDSGQSPLQATRTILSSDAYRPYRAWECPERLYITVMTLFRAFEGLGPLGATPRDRLKVFATVARLAAELR